MCIYFDDEYLDIIREEIILKAKIDELNNEIEQVNSNWRWNSRLFDNDRKRRLKKLEGFLLIINMKLTKTIRHKTKIEKLLRLR